MHDDHDTPSTAMIPLIEQVEVHGLRIWDPCAGRGQMATMLEAQGASVLKSDITLGIEYDVRTAPIPSDIDMVITNPPFSIKRAIVERFIREGLAFALLLPLSTMCDKWYRSVADQISVVPIYGRITFIGHDHSCPFYCAWFISKYPS